VVTSDRRRRREAHERRLIRAQPNVVLSRLPRLRNGLLSIMLARLGA
jgi:hypothetical protein